MIQGNKRTIEQQCKIAKEASIKLNTLSTQFKNLILTKLADSLLENENYILTQNKLDIDNGRKNGMSESLVDRLMLNSKRITGCSNALNSIATLDDPVGKTLDGWETLNGLKIKKIRVPLGVFGMIYEARPNVTVDAIGLGIKTGNGIVLRGSSSAYQTNRAIVTVFENTLRDNGYPVESVQLLDDTSREGVQVFVRMKDYLDLIIPRGGAGLINSVVDTATVPTIETGTGNCHIYVDSRAKIDQSLKIILNAKTHRTSVCNSCESLVIHKDIAKNILPKLVDTLSVEGVEIRGCEKACKLSPSIIPADENDWGTEYLDLIISVKIVDTIEEAIDHIQEYGTKHTEAILSEDYDSIQLFTKLVDASAVLVNTSTRFTDGEMFGFGAEIGISTQKLHARGPMGLPELTSYKYIVEGSGQIRD